MRSQAGAAPDFDAFFEVYWPRICNFLVRFTGDPQEAQDLALEAFMRLYERPGLLDEAHNTAGWLYRVAANLGYNALRARKRRRNYETLAPLPQAGQDPVEAAEVQMEKGQVREVLAEMRPRSAKLLLLRHAGLSYQELAAALEVAPGSIGTLLNRAQKDFEKRYRRRFG